MPLEKPASIERHIDVPYNLDLQTSHKWKNTKGVTGTNSLDKLNVPQLVSDEI